jgi:hypothetical protein
MAFRLKNAEQAIADHEYSRHLQCSLYGNRHHTPFDEWIVNASGLILFVIAKGSRQFSGSLARCEQRRAIQRFASTFFAILTDPRN